MVKTILSMTFFSSILIVIVVILRALFLHRIPKKTFLILWGIVVCRLLFPFSISSSFSIYTWIESTKKVNITQEETFLMQEQEIEPLLSKNESIMRKQPIALSASLSPILVIWGFGFFGCLLFFLLTHFHCQRKYNMSLPIENDFLLEWQRTHSIYRKISIRVSDKIDGPLTYGIRKPVIVLPKMMNNTDRNQLEYVLTHEYIHIKQFDLLKKWILVIIACLHWFNPFLWVMYILANRDIELACDEKVVQILGEDRKSAYALTLIEMEEKRRGLSPMCNNFSKNSMEERIESIMKMKKTTIFTLFFACFLIIGTAVAFGTSSKASSKEKEVSETVVQEQENEEQEAISTPTQEDILKEYGIYGISFDENGKMLYNGVLVRYFWDGYTIEDLSSRAIRYEYKNKDGIVDIHTVRTVIDNEDGSIDRFGELIGIIEYEEEYISDFLNSSELEATTTEMIGQEGGEKNSIENKTFAERFAVYKEYGIEYKEGPGDNSGWGNVYYNGELVNTFIDEKKDGGIFTYQSRDGGEIIVSTIYDESGKLIGIEKK